MHKNIHRIYTEMHKNIHAPAILAHMIPQKCRHSPNSCTYMHIFLHGAYTIHNLTSAYMYQQTKFKATGKKVYIVGERGISEELDLIGVPWYVCLYICMYVFIYVNMWECAHE
jgi:hypothetical protein